MKRLDIYTDGSYNKQYPEYTYGAYYCDGLDDVNGIFKTSIAEATSMWNVGGELLAAICALTFAQALANKLAESGETLTCNIIYDYEGVGKWVTGEWKAKKPMTKSYVRYVRGIISNTPCMKVNFHWVKGHEGNSGNEKADLLAKSGLTNPETCLDMDELVKQVLGR